MPPFLLSVLSTVAGTVAAAPALDALRALYARRAQLGGPRAGNPTVSQVAPVRAVLTPPVSSGPPVPLPASTPASFAARLAARR